MLSNKTLIIIISVLILLAGGFLIYYYYFLEEPQPPTTTTPPNGQPISTERLNPISQEPVLGVTIDSQKVKYYLKSNGNVYQSNLDGSTPVRISSSILSNLLDVFWSPSKNKVIALFEENNTARTYSYDYITKISTPLSENIEWITWAPSQDQIAYQYGKSISTANADGSNWRTILETEMKNLIVEWPKPDQLSIRTRPSGLAQSVAYTLDIANSGLRKIIDQTYGLILLWSPLGNKVLFSETNQEGKDLKLKVLDLEKQTTEDLKLATLPEKCVWSQDNRTIFCAVPKEIPGDSILPDDFYQENISFSDDFYRINLETDAKTRILETKEAIPQNIKELLLSPQEDYLIFINQDGQLYSLKL